VFDSHLVIPSFIDRLPGAHRQHRFYLPLMPFALEHLDLGNFDIVLAFSYAVAHAASTRPDQLHLSYIHTPLRYAWRPELVPQLFPGLSRLPRWLVDRSLGLFRHWDTAQARRTDVFLANSYWMADQVWRAYHRRAEVLYPPVDPDFYQIHTSQQDYYLTVSRLVRHKRLDLVVQACSQLGLPLVVVGEGPEAARLRTLAGPGVRFLGWQPQDKLLELLGGAKALVHAGQEDFGIALAEAQAAGRPVIALRSSAAAEIAVDGWSGLLFEEQRVDHLAEALARFEHRGVEATPSQIRDHARRFERRFFQLGLERLVEEKLEFSPQRREGTKDHEGSIKGLCAPL
jgi:glycosyltransferase involved in cell wall biosynthesis